MIKSALTEIRIFDFRAITKVYIILCLKPFTQIMKQTQQNLITISLIKENQPFIEHKWFRYEG